MKREGGRYIVDPQSGKPELVQQTRPAVGPVAATPATAEAPKAGKKPSPAKSDTATGKDD